MSGASRDSAGERLIVAALCVLAAVRVFIYSAAFPFFSQVDENLHFDLIGRYARAQPPKSFDVLSEQALDWIVPYASPEFLQKLERFEGGKFPPPLWKQSGPEAEAVAAVTRAAWREVNFESSQPPLYYCVGAGWWRLGQLFGTNRIDFLYWLRFLNVLLYALVVWFGYAAVRVAGFKDVDLRVGVPLLLAFFPQNVFYAMNNDVLLPVTGGVLFICVLRWLKTDSPLLALGVATGLSMAAAVLTKLASTPLLVIAVIAVAATSLRNARQKLPALGLAILCAAVPIAMWIAWNKAHFGDATGSATKAVLLGWTPKPFAQWWDHPMFTARGLSIFWSDLLATFWRGELKWQNEPLRWIISDWFYVISSLMVLAIAAVGVIIWPKWTRPHRAVIATALGMFVASIVFLALLSLQFDFGNRANPSRANPYFSNGRLMMGALIPFVLVYVHTIARLCRAIHRAAPLFVLAMIVAFVAGSEIWINRVAFASEHNWFHR